MVGCVLMGEEWIQSATACESKLRAARQGGVEERSNARYLVTAYWSHNSNPHEQSVFLVHPLMLPGSLLKPFARTHAPLPPALPPFHAHHVSFPERIEAEDGRKRGHPMFSREAMVTWAVEVRSHIVVQAAIDKRGNFT